MNKKLKHFPLFAIVFLCLFFSLAGSCKKNTALDAQGRLIAQHLTSSSGSLEFAPMLLSDAESVSKFKPDTFYFHQQPYTGEIASYDDNQKLLIDGHLKNGLCDGAWKFYFGTGGVHMEGNYNMGYETGLWNSYIGYGKLNVVKYYNDRGLMLMREDYYDENKLKDYENIACAQFGGRMRRIDFDNSGKITYIDAEPGVTSMQANDIMEKIKNNGFMVK